jgi:hypothetical protein
MFVPSQPTATKYQLVVLAMAVVESTVVAVFPVALTENLILCVLLLNHTSHSAFGRLYRPRNDASYEYVNVAALVQNVAKKWLAAGAKSVEDPRVKHAFPGKYRDVLIIPAMLPTMPLNSPRILPFAASIAVVLLASSSL